LTRHTHQQIGSGNWAARQMDWLKSKHNANWFDKFPGIKVDIPSLVVVCTDLFDVFLQHNDLYQIGYSDLSDDRIAQAFQKADLPFEILGDLRALIDQVHTHQLFVHQPAGRFPA
jgi:hypothetical protein